MAMKQMLTCRLSPELIDEINDMASAENLTIEALLSAGLDSLKRAKNDHVTTTERVRNIENQLLSLVNTITPFLTLLVEAEDRSFKAWANSRLSLAWSDLVVSSGGMPPQSKWMQVKADLQNTLKRERDEIVAARRKSGGRNE